MWSDAQVQSILTCFGHYYQYTWLSIRMLGMNARCHLYCLDGFPVRQLLLCQHDNQIEQKLYSFEACHCQLCRSRVQLKVALRLILVSCGVHECMGPSYFIWHTHPHMHSYTYSHGPPSSLPPPFYSSNISRTFLAIRGIRLVMG